MTRPAPHLPPWRSVQHGSLRGAVFAAAAAAGIAQACGDDVEIGAFLAESGPAAGAAALDSGDAVAPCVELLCGQAVFACGNCEDDDVDGRIDMDDPECVGPCDDSESVFATTLEDVNQAPCRQDCFFDADTGHGNDQCYWSHACDPLSVPPAYPPEGPLCAYNPAALIPGAVGATCDDLFAAQGPACAEFCPDRTPNGCDCFGCCDLPGAPTPVWIGARDLMRNPTCDAASAADPARCPPCTPVPSCANPCEQCELCLGETELPPECGSGGSGCAAPACPNGAEPCGLDCLAGCRAGFYCVTGCCRELPK